MKRLAPLAKADRAILFELSTKHTIYNETDKTMDKRGAPPPPGGIPDSATRQAGEDDGTHAHGSLSESPPAWAEKEKVLTDFCFIYSFLI